MHMIRRLSLIPVLAFAAGCFTEPPEKIGPVQNRPGFFSVTIQAFNVGPTSGTASFRLEPSSQTSNFSLTFNGSGSSAGTVIELSGPSVPTVGADFAIGTEEGQFSGELRRPTATGLETYSLTSGSLTVESVSATQVVGEIEFAAVQTSGPAVGTEVTGKGTYRATGGNTEK